VKGDARPSPAAAGLQLPVPRRELLGKCTLFGQALLRHLWWNVFK
jgi:hypothetical protein